MVEHDKKIMHRLSEHLDAVKEKHPEWVGIFLQGSQNYKLDYEGSDVDSKLIILPSFEDFVLNRKPQSYTHIIVVDVLLHIMENLYDAMPYLFDGMVVGSFFSGIGAFEKALTRLQTEPHEYSSISKEDMPNLQQVGYINDYNGDANRVYSGDGVSRTLKADAGGGGAKTGWYTVPRSA